MSRPGPAAEAVIEVTNLWKIFGSREAEALAAIRRDGLSKAEALERFGCILGVADVSFRVSRGETFCIMGLSGSGKSTVLRHLNRLIRPSAGAVTLLGEDVLTMSDKALRRLRATRIGMVFQHMALMPHWTVRENVMFPLAVQKLSRPEAWRTAQHALSLVNLDGYEDYAPAQLSGGMKQRVGLARALASDPAILLMDEPFGALDPLIRRQLQDLFLALSQQLDKTAVFITHDLDEAIRMGDRIAIMKDGRMVQIGSASEIVFSPADAYVVDFVRDLARTKLLTAESMMRPLGADGRAPEETAAWVALDAGFEQIAALAIGHDGPLAVKNESGVPVGQLGKDDLLRAILTEPPEPAEESAA